MEAELVVVESQQQGSQPAAWLDENDDQWWNIMVAELRVVEKQQKESQPVGLA